MDDQSVIVKPRSRRSERFEVCVRPKCAQRRHPQTGRISAPMLGRVPISEGTANPRARPVARRRRRCACHRMTIPLSDPVAAGGDPDRGAKPGRGSLVPPTSRMPLRERRLCCVALPKHLHRTDRWPVHKNSGTAGQLQTGPGLPLALRPLPRAGAECQRQAACFERLGDSQDARTLCAPT